MIAKIGRTYNELESKALIAALMLMVIVTFSNVIMRYVFSNALFWAEEFSRYLFIWFSWIGVSAGLKDNAHLRVEILGNTLVKRGFCKTNETLTLFISIIWLVTTLIVVYYGFVVLEMQMKLNVVTPAMRLPLWVMYLSIPISGLLVGIRLLISMGKNVKFLFDRSNKKSEVKG